MVPMGVGTSTDTPSRPLRLLPSPWRPRSALCSGLKRKWSSVLWCGLATRTTSPPCPPSPPLGPPRGTYFSRRKARQPLPPSPAFTRIFTSSINNEGSLHVAHALVRPWSRLVPTPWLLRYWRFRHVRMNVHELPHSPAIA